MKASVAIYTKMIRDDSLVTEWCNLRFLNLKFAATFHVEKHSHNGIASSYFFPIKSMYGISTYIWLNFFMVN